MRAAVGVTNAGWAAFLRDRPHLSEANFWVPNPKRTWNVADRGGAFLFKTHWPENRLVGGGFVSDYTQLRVSEAWAFFGEGNGVASQADLLTAIRNHRSDYDPDPVIGCVMLHNLFFVPEDRTLPGPTDFAKNIVQWKSYEHAGSVVEDALQRMLTEALPREISGPVFGDPRLMVPRLGQQAFKGMVLTAYHRRCAVTGAKIVPVLQAAHIRPVSRQGQHRIDNGLLLRSDVHTLFDAGYLGVDDRHRIQVSPALRRDFGNGAEFYARQGTGIELPASPSARPSREALTWHMDTVFQR